MCIYNWILRWFGKGNKTCEDEANTIDNNPILSLVETAIRDSEERSIVAFEKIITSKIENYSLCRRNKSQEFETSSDIEYIMDSPASNINQYWRAYM